MGEVPELKTNKISKTSVTSCKLLDHFSNNWLLLPLMLLAKLVKKNRTSALTSMEVSTLPSVVLLEVSDGTKNNKTSSSVSCLLSLAASWEVPELKTNKISKTSVTSCKLLDHFSNNWLLLPLMLLANLV